MKCEARREKWAVSLNIFGTLLSLLGIDGVNNSPDIMKTNLTPIPPLNFLCSCGFESRGVRRDACPQCGKTRASETAAKHSPLPWNIWPDRFVSVNGSPKTQPVIGTEDAPVCYVSKDGGSPCDEANAQLIVTAVNSHAALVGALEHVLARLEAVRAQAIPGDALCSWFVTGDHGLYGTVTKALALAGKGEGGQK